ncbi:hypothetical protein DPMN_124252 [Dreissena polymorpha]|uniref:Uncharacterized protein n=1 Tax=Dreissena polymorpha TaxID=45954 RepID=A0A9D4GT46_DREPO|nr:hypothetical protein DPMN_124252 [Dreissena polymorpha]
MKACVPHFLEILVSLISDDYSKVAEGSRHALELFSTSQSVTDQQHRLTELLEDNMLKLTTSLPRQIQTAGKALAVFMCNKDRNRVAAVWENWA